MKTLNATLIEIREKDHMQTWKTDASGEDEYLKIIYLRPTHTSRTFNIELGQKAILEYRSTTSYGLWFLKEIIKEI